MAGKIIHIMLFLATLMTCQALRRSPKTKNYPEVWHQACDKFCKEAAGDIQVIKDLDTADQFKIGMLSAIELTLDKAKERDCDCELHDQLVLNTVEPKNILPAGFEITAIGPIEYLNSNQPNPTEKSAASTRSSAVVVLPNFLLLAMAYFNF